MTLNVILGILGSSELFLFIIIFVVIGVIITSRKEADVVIPANQNNKVVNVSLIGGIIGNFISSPRNELNAIIRVENTKGWKVIQVIPADSGNFFLYIFRFLLLICTLFLYTKSNGYYIIMEKIQADNNNQIVKDLKCSKCEKEFSSNMKGTFCEDCGNKL